MTLARRPIFVALVLVASAFIVAGCGGGGDAGAAADAGGTPTPGATTPGTGVADAGTGTTDPALGAAGAMPVDGANGTSDGGTTATVPDLVGDNVGGLEPVSGNTPLFDPHAVSDAALDALDDKTDEADKTETATEQQPTIVYSGAKIYVDGIVHSVTRNGTFPKGNPVFRLLSVTANDIEIELIAGEFTSSGGDGTYLDLGDMVSLVNASEQVTYRVKYLRPITATTGVQF